MSLFPDIKIGGHAFKEGLDANGGPLQKVIQKNQFTEALRGQPFRRKLASILARIRTPVRMPHSSLPQLATAPVIVNRSRRPILLEYLVQQPQRLHPFLQHPS